MEKSANEKKFLLVQYSMGSKCLVHAMIPANDVNSPKTIQSDTRDVIVQNGQQECQASVLLLNENERLVEKKFKKLKNIDFQEIFHGEYYSNAYANGEWFLVQYTCTPFKIVYKILNQRDTFWPGNNLYKDVVTYFREDETVYQAIILQKSHIIDDLIIKLNHLRDVTLNLHTKTPNMENSQLNLSACSLNSPSKLRKFAFYERLLRNKGT